MQLSVNPSLFQIPFGKHKGRSVEAVYNSDKSYLDWCMKQDNIVMKNPKLVDAIMACSQGNNKEAASANIVPRERHLVPTTVNNILNERCIGETLMLNRVDSIIYGEYINFPEQRIRTIMQNLDIGVGTIDKIFILMRATGNNVNAGLANYADKFFNKPGEHDGIKLVSERDWEDTFKICLAWKYGVIKDKYRSTAFGIFDSAMAAAKLLLKAGINCIQEMIVKMWKDGNSMDEIIQQLTEKMNKEDKDRYGPNARKYCRKLPYMFTPAMYQLYLLGISKDEMSSEGTRKKKTFFFSQENT